MVITTILNIGGFFSNIEYLIEKIPFIGGSLGNIFHYVFDTSWGLLLFLVIGLIIQWLFVKARLEATNEYQEKSSSASVGVKAMASFMVRRAGIIPKWEFDTQNRKNEELKVECHIQSVRFIRPTEKVIRINELPAFVYCERKRILRFKNWVFGIPQPRIVVKKFTENGIIFDEENTIGADVSVEFYLGN